MSYYLEISEKWYVYLEGRWQFLGDEAPGSQLEVVIASGADILDVCRLVVDEQEPLCKLGALHPEPETSWVMYREAEKEAKDGLAKEG